jgi:hypothetical protein
VDDRDKGENRSRKDQHNENDDHPKQPDHKAFLRFALSRFVQGKLTFSFWPTHG